MTSRGLPSPQPPVALAVLLQRAVDEAVKLLGVDVAIIYLVSADGQEAVFSYECGIDDEEQRRIAFEARVPIGQGMVGQALASGETLITGDYESDERFWDRAHREEMRNSLGLHSVVVTPMLGSDGVAIGVLCTFARTAHDFSTADVALVSALAAHAALAIENSWLIERLSKAEAEHRFLLEHLPDAVWAVDADGRLTYMSEGSERIVGYRPEELVGRSWRPLLHESTRETFEDAYRWQVEHPHLEQTYRGSLRHKDGHAVPVEMHNVGIVVDGRYAGAHGSVRETSERDRMERELRAQAAELAANQERAHLAQELHDSVTQALFSMTLTAGAARILLARDPAAVGAKLDELTELARDALAEMRSLIFELRPGSLAEEGFLPALRKHIAAVQGRTGLAIRLAADDDLGRLPLPIEDALYRIAQEAIHNVVKHAAAESARLEIARSAGSIRMAVSDDGIGFDTATRSDGIGLASMRSRADRLGGQLEVESRQGEGTCVRVTFPVPASAG